MTTTRDGNLWIHPKFFVWVGRAMVNFDASGPMEPAEADEYIQALTQAKKEAELMQVQQDGQ